MDIIRTKYVDGSWQTFWRDHVLPCAIGAQGIIDASAKVEGDKKTPAGLFKVLYGFYRSDRLDQPQTKILMHPTMADDGWCDATEHMQYNQKIKKPFDASHEDLWRDDHLYDLVLVVDYNIAPIISGKGSAIFIHCAPEDGSSSAGCLTLPQDDLLMILHETSAQLYWQIVP